MFPVSVGEVQQNGMSQVQGSDGESLQVVWGGVTRSLNSWEKSLRFPSILFLAGVGLQCLFSWGLFKTWFEAQTCKWENPNLDISVFSQIIAFQYDVLCIQRGCF